MEPIGRELKGELARLGPAGAISDVVDAWPAAVGPAVARNAWPARIGRDGTLHVHASSSAWAFELSQLAREISVRLRTALGSRAPGSLRFAVGPVPEAGAEAAEDLAQPRRSATPEERRLAASLTAGLADDELRRLVARAAAASLARATAGRAF
jgi:hypothetical protein